ncbi:uncharacterized protein LOC110117779 [Ceratitis capitata]|uniref:uncharacterized protein LOC110117779 n=1 Tax=Ceratitis capitata TaxID=7213 RepID=UPI000A10C673|nr:uncharacterized protein LOC110117779 [Ceratitis capitata]
MAVQESPWTEPKRKKAHARYTTTNGHTKEHKFSVGFYERDRVSEPIGSSCTVYAKRSYAEDHNSTEKYFFRKLLIPVIVIHHAIAPYSEHGNDENSLSFQATFYSVFCLYYRIFTYSPNFHTPTKGDNFV